MMMFFWESKVHIVQGMYMYVYMYVYMYMYMPYHSLVSSRCSDHK